MWKENGRRNPCELWIQSEVHRTGTQRCFELEMGHIWYQGLRKLKVTHRRSALPSCFVLSWEFLFPEVFSFQLSSLFLHLPAKISYMKDELGGCSSVQSFLTVCCSSSPCPSEGLSIAWRFQRNRRAAMSCWQKRFDLLKCFFLAFFFFVLGSRIASQSVKSCFVWSI